MNEKALAIAFIVLGWAGAFVFALSTIAFAGQGGTAWIMVPVCALGVIVMSLVGATGWVDLHRPAGSPEEGNTK